jgi:hypothetical protein
MVPNTAVMVGVDLVVPRGDVVDDLHGRGHNLLCGDICGRGVGRAPVRHWVATSSVALVACSWELRRRWSSRCDGGGKKASLMESL